MHFHASRIGQATHSLERPMHDTEAPKPFSGVKCHIICIAQKHMTGGHVWGAIRNYWPCKHDNSFSTHFWNAQVWMGPKTERLFN